jgi:membrane-associated phospholipid phosphatase
MQFLTDFADQAVALPLALCIAAWLGLAGWRRGALVWLAAFATLEIGMLALKLMLLGCTPGALALTSPSGHTAASVLVYGGAAGLAGRLRPRWTMAAGCAAALLFGATRLALHAHSVPEIVVGGAAGLAALAFFTWRAGPAPASLPRAPAMLALLVLAVALHGVRLDLEPRWRHAGRWLGCLSG